MTESNCAAEEAERKNRVCSEMGSLLKMEGKEWRHSEGFILYFKLCMCVHKEVCALECSVVEARREPQIH